MAAHEIVPETEVLMATIIFLIKRGAQPIQISVPRGKGINTHKAQHKISDAFKSIGHQATFISYGPDIIAASQNEWWKIECKGAGSGKKQTQRNNFDRALSSVVSYYEDKPPTQFPNAKLFLGLSLPSTSDYLSLLEKKVRTPLRMKLNLWILLYNSNSNSIRSISPSAEMVP